MQNFQNIVGRKAEIQALLDAYNSKSPEFIAVYGRRRVGKTYLVKEVFRNKFAFVYTGIAKITNKEQLDAFRTALISRGHTSCPVLRDWIEAFSQLAAFLDTVKAKRKVVFIDELPWLDARGSRFVSALEHFWNGWATYHDEILLVVCGSATSWIVNKVINSHGGLHNRLTEQIYLRPFTLAECEEYLTQRGLKMSRLEIVQAYMALGGIPYYLSMLKKGKSLVQNLNSMCFSRGGALTTEYFKLYESLFNNPQPYLSIVNALKGKTYGLTREEIAHQCRMDGNGHLSRYLEELVQCDFVRRCNSLGYKTKDAVYQLIDNFTIFYFSFMEQAVVDDYDYWQGMSNTNEYRVWSGLAFERVCLWHLPEIKRSLGIAGVITNAVAWRTTKEQAQIYGGAQVDLAIVRNDGVINLCEMKFAKSPYVINKAEDEKLRHRVSTFETLAAKKYAVHLTMVAPFGLQQNIYSPLVQSQVTLDDLFAPSCRR